MRRPPIFVLALWLTVSAVGAAEPAWWQTAVAPVVGPFSATSGPAGITLDQILADFRPEAAEWSVLPKQTSSPYRPRLILGGLEYQEFPQAPKRDFELWQKLFGFAYAPTEENGVAVPSSGQISSFKYGSENENSLHFTCHNAPRWHQFHRESILVCARNSECALIRQDNIGGPSGVGSDNGGWCKWCLAGYQERLLARLSPEQLRQCGIADAGRFEPRPFLLAARQRPAEERIENAAVREYVRYLLKSNLDAWRDEVDSAHRLRPEVPVCGNQGSVGLESYPYVLLSDVGDLIFLENSRRSYPRGSNTVDYAVTLAGGRHRKPAWIWGFGHPADMTQVAGSQLFVAECYATGATPYYEMNNLAWTAQKGYYAIALGRDAYTALAGYARFAREHRDLLAQSYRAEAAVALLYSVPSFLPRHLGALGLHLADPGAARLVAHFRGFARALEADHIAYNVEVLGDEEMWPDRDLDQRLARYRVVICPSVEALSDAQLASLQRFQQAGGRLVVSGDLATRNAGFARRAAPAGEALLRAAGTARLADEPAQYDACRAVRDARGLSQVVQVNQTAARPLVIRGWSKAERVSKPTDTQYSLWVDLTYTDGSPLWAQVAPFKAGTHDWQQSEFVIHPAKPVKSATVHVLFRYHSGRAWFDDLFFGEQGAERNLLQNPGLEGAEGAAIPGWQAVLGWQKTAAGYTRSPAAHGGSQSAQCEIVEPTGEPAEVVRLRTALRESLRGVPRLATNAPDTVFVRPVRQGNRLVVHLLNLNWDDDLDRVSPAGPVKLSLPVPTGARPAGVTLCSPDQPADRPLAVTVQDGVATVEVPELKVWSLVVLEG